MNMDKKRGTFLVAFVLLIISINASLAANEVIANTAKITSLVKTMNPGYASCGCQDDCGWIEDCFYDSAPAGLYFNQASGVERVNAEQRAGIVLKEYGDSGFGDCGESTSYAGTTPKSNGRTEKGCYMVIVDEDDLAGNSDDGAWGIATVETIFTNKWSKDVNPNPQIIAKDTFCGWNTGDQYNGGWAALNCAWFRVEDGKTYLCSDDEYWHRCDAAAQSTVTWANNFLYNCTMDEGGVNPLWEEVDIDLDQDGFPSSQDCADNPNAPGLNQENCPVRNKDGTFNCDYTKGEDRKCAICINKNAPETCGDELNNDCGGGMFASEAVTNKEGKTPDDCNKNQYGCMQSPPPAGLDQSTQIQLNKYHQNFAWVDTINNGYCCGYNGFTDFGKQIQDRNGGKYLCANKNLVGSESDITQFASKIGTDDWYLLKASDQDAQFKVLTLKVPGEQPYDVLSDSDGWKVCNASSMGGLDVSTQSDLVDKSANHFFCYAEGQHWSWAECFGDTAPSTNKNVKGRRAGDGLYSLYLDMGNSVKEEGGEAIYQGIKLVLSAGNGKYNEFYKISSTSSVGAKFSVAKYDFSGYDTLEFFVRFISQKGGNSSTYFPELDLLPVDITLEIKGPQGMKSDGTDKPDLPFFTKKVLGYTVNTPVFGEDNWMHVKVPIPSNLTAVSSVIISSDPNVEKNQIQIKNIYLSNSNTPQICSGKNDANRNSWLTSFDDGDSVSRVNAEDMCKSHYGENAWLGNEEEVKGELNQDTSHCCGNDLNEYFRGMTKSGYGCWNSQSVAPGATTSNVEFKIKYTESNTTIKYSSSTVSYHLEATYSLDPNVDSKEIKKVKDHLKTVPATSGEISYGMYRLDEDINTPLPPYRPYPITWKNGSTTTVRHYLQNVKIVNDAPDQAKVYLFNTLTGDLIEDQLYSGDLVNGMKDFVVIAETRQVNLPKLSTFSVNKTITLPCAQESCYFLLPGSPPYTLTNSHPDLYKLYFVESKGKETLITNNPKQEFKISGMVKATEVAQQVIYVNSEAPQPTNSTEETTTAAPEQDFYGCQAADYLMGGDLLSDSTNLPYCRIKGNMFCSPSAAQTKGTSQYTTINSWSNETLEEVGYEEPQEGEQNATDFFANFKLELKDALIFSTQRNYTAPLLPGRNFLPNANFALDKDKLPHWEISPVPPSGALKNKVIAQSTNNYLIKLEEQEILRSEKIALFPNQTLHFSQNSTCGYQFVLVDKNGNVTIYDTPDFETESASYLMVEFIGPGEVFQPQLQLVDDLGVNKYDSNDEYNEKNSARSGAACCPDNHCWNGYACVEDMTKFTSMVDSVGENRFYRCVEGEWNHYPPKRDWTNDLVKWGFCPQQEQCFVLSHNFGGVQSYTAQDFYQGKYPTCINSREYIFDHYCENGQWTSRTKFLASKLLEVINEGDDYELYCDNYQQVLLDFAEKDNYLGGTIAQQVATNTDDLLATEIITEGVSTCFDKIMDGEGKRLIQDDENLHENTCINNVCILKYQEGGTTKVAFATTLNKPLNDSSSFLLALNVPLSGLETVCPLAEINNVTEFVPCDLGGEIEGDLWYAPQLNAVVFAKEGISLSPSFFSSVVNKAVDWLGGLFGTGSNQLSSESKFVSAAENYHQLYLSSRANGETTKKVRALQEYFSPEKQTLIVEYENYETPVCDYLLNLKTPPELNVELFKEVSGEGKLNCSTQDAVQRVEAIAGLKFLWPQLTANLRAEIK
ncbi:MAG: hypothetical protein V2A62_05690 [Candidatus Woesearchaeota archaeon]